MSMEEQFQELRRVADEQGTRMREKFFQQNGDLGALMDREGFKAEYVRETDHLYVTLGQPRIGMALTLEPVVFMADPETLEWLGIEVLELETSIRDGVLNGDTWGRL